MLLVTHAVVGASLATKIKNPFFSLPLILASHFLMDFFPHWDLGTDFFNRSKRKNVLLAFFDSLVSLLLVFFLFQFKKPFSLLPWLGSGLGLLPDFLEAPYFFCDLRLFPKLDHFHSDTCHRENNKVFWGLLPQLLILGVVLWII